MPVGGPPGGGSVTAMAHHSVDTPLGTLWLSGDGGRLSGVAFAAARRTRSAEPLFAEAEAQLHAYFAGELERFDLPLAPRGTEFQRRVWDALGEIPYGSTTTYSGLAAAIGRPGACRAVGAANGRNPLPVIVPCHRVIGAAGALTGYGGGLERKRTLLDLETRSRLANCSRMGRRSRRRAQQGGAGEAAPASTTDYRDAEGGVLTLRDELSAGTLAQLAQLDSKPAATAEDRWQRRSELLFERLAVRWEIVGLPLETQKELLGRYRMASAGERRWVRETLTEHLRTRHPEVDL